MQIERETDVAQVKSKVKRILKLNGFVIYDTFKQSSAMFSK